MQKVEKFGTSESEVEMQFLSERELTELKDADANIAVRFSGPDKSIPFIILANGVVVVDNTANNPKTILYHTTIAIPDEPPGAGYIDIHHGNRTLLFRRIESAIFGKRWHINEVVSAIQFELNLYYPGYQIRFH